MAAALTPNFFDGFHQVVEFHDRHAVQRVRNASLSNAILIS
jgi:hypothetical protein